MEERIWVLIARVRSGPAKHILQNGYKKIILQNSYILFIFSARMNEYKKVLSQELHRPVRKKFRRRKVVSGGKDDIWALDLADMNEDKDKGYRYFLVVVDVFSRYAWVRPLKNKTGEEVRDALEEVIKDNGGKKPNHLWVDKGKEFYNKSVEKLGINMYSTYSQSKVSIAEAFIKNIKSKLWRIFDEKNTRKWVDELPGLVKTYNNTIHSAIKMKPNDARKKSKADDVKEVNDKDLIKRGEDVKKKPAKFAIDDWVRISRDKGIFEKGFHSGWTREIFQVYSKSYHKDEKIWTYKLKEYDGTPIEGSFYEEEMQKTKLDGDTWLVDKILEKKKGKVLVSWLGWPKKYNSWVNEKDVRDV